MLLYTRTRRASERVEVDRNSTRLLIQQTTSTMSKDLLSSRLVNSLRTHLETDLSILGRLHYKNQSQHHLALFWRRVVEVDRVGRRLLPAWERALQDGAKHQDVRKLSLLVSRVSSAWPSTLLEQEESSS